MRQGQGSAGTMLLECIDPNNNKWRVRWNVKPIEGSNDVVYTEEDFDHKPTLDEVKELITAQINADIDNKILTGFVWNDMPVWLSSENQFNYKAAYDLAAQTGGATLPVRFKFGIGDVPTYHTFNDLAELTDFYTKALAYVNTTLNNGWEAKDNIDWSKYE